MVKKVLLISLIIFLIGGVFASCEVGNLSHSIESSYTKSSNIIGWVNMSFTNEPATNKFTDSLENSISLIDLLKAGTNNYDYNCTPENCESFYTASSPNETKIIHLDAGESKLIGFKLNGWKISSINSISFKIKSNATANCSNQLKLNLFNNEIIDAGNNKTTQDSCQEKKFGCYADSYATDFSLNEYGYCQKIRLSEAPSFFVGAKIKNDSGHGNVTMKLYDKEGDDLGSCEINENKINNYFSDEYCSINYSVPKQDYYFVCISSYYEGYKIKGYNKNNGCGFYRGYSSFGDEMPAAYSIFAQSKKFDSVGTLQIEDFSYESEDYLLNKYGSLEDCENKACIIPIKIISGTDNQEINLTDLEIEINTILGQITIKNFYNISETSAKIDSDFQKIYLEKGNFSVPDQIGNYTFNLKFNNNLLFSQIVNVKKTASIISVNPLTTAVALPTTFRVRLDNDENITKYSWDFGDNSTIETITNQAKHTYNNLTNYPLKITIEDKDGTKISKTFNILVGSANQVLNNSIDEKLQQILNIKTEIFNYDSFSAKAIKNILNLNETEHKILEIKHNYTLTNIEEEYKNLLTQILEIEIPQNISKTFNIDLGIFFPKKENINLEALKFISNETYESEKDEQYKNSILTKGGQEISMNEYSANYKGGETMLVRVFEIKTNQESYLIIKDMENLKFEDNLTYESGYYYKILENSETTKFYTTEKINIEDLPLFISPDFSDLVLFDIGTPEEAGKEFKWVLFVIAIIILILIIFGIYLFLKKWYKEKYENYLFKDKNDLYNMVRYIQNSKQNKMDDLTIKKNLKKAKWNSEQIKYIMKKYAGKKTGMPELFKKKTAKTSYQKIY